MTPRVWCRKERAIVYWVTEGCTGRSLGCRWGGYHEPRSRNVKSEISGNLSKEIKKAFKSVWESDLGWFYKGESPQHRDRD